MLFPSSHDADGSLPQLPTILADNAGYDSADLVSKLRAAHYEGRSDAGLGKDLHLSSPLKMSFSDSLALVQT